MRVSCDYICRFGGRKLHQHPVVLICKILTLNKVQYNSIAISQRGEINKTIIPFALVGYGIGYTISYPTRDHGIIVN